MIHFKWEIPKQREKYVNRPKEKLFIFDIVTAFKNRGDLLINRALIHSLRAYGRVLVTTDHLPEKFRDELELKPEECDSNLRVILRKNLFKFDVYKVGIPGHSFDKQARFLAGVSEILITLVFKYLLRVKFLRVGTSFGPIHKYRINIERLKAKFYTLYGVRDQASVQLCAPSNMAYFPDLAFISPDIYPANKDENDESYHFISFRAKFPDASVKEDYLSSIIEKLTKYVSTQKVRSIVIGYQVPEDSTPCELIYQALQQLPGIKVKYIPDVLELDEAIAIISKAEMVLSNRLHIILPALISGVPHIALTDSAQHKKICALYDSIGANFVIHDVNDSKEVTIHPDNNREKLLGITQQQNQIATDVLKSRLG